MAHEFRLPDIGEGLTEAVVVKWLVAVGEAVGLDVPMVEMETDKAVVEIPAPVGGVMLHHGAAEGDTIEVDEILAVIGEAGEKWERSPEPTTAQAAPIVGTLPEAGPAAGVQALPAVRKAAAELGIDLATVTGTGPGGRVTEEDVRASGAGGPIERVSLSPTRKAIAGHLSRSWREIPHVTTYGHADASRVLDARHDSGLPMEAYLIKAVVAPLHDNPVFNASLVGDDVLMRKYYDNGFAVDTPDGLMVAVIKGANELSLDELGAEVARLGEAARQRTATPQELRGQTFTVSNIGAVGGGFGTPIIPYGTTAILSVGRADPTAAVVDDQVVVGRRFPLSLSYDHRVIDGASGRRFLGAVTKALEESR